MTWAAVAGPDPALRLLGLGLLGLLLLIAVLIRLALSYRTANNRTRAQWTRREGVWEPAVLGVLGGTLADAELHRQVGLADRLYFIEYLLRFARRLQGEERAVIERLAAPYLPLIAARLDQRDDEFRARAISTLSALGLQEYGRQVVAALDDRSDLVAMVAARSLARPGSPEYAEEILRRLGRFRQWRPSFLASILAQMGLEAAPVLRQTLTDSTVDPGVRAVAAEALRELHDPAAADPAAEVVRTNHERDLVAASLGMLMEVGQQHHVEAVRPLIASKEPILRARAYAIIARLGGAEDVVMIRQAFRDDSPWVTIRVVDTLRAVGALEVLAQLGEAS